MKHPFEYRSFRFSVPIFEQMFKALTERVFCYIQLFLESMTKVAYPMTLPQPLHPFFFAVTT